MVLYTTNINLFIDLSIDQTHEEGSSLYLIWLSQAKKMTFIKNIEIKNILLIIIVLGDR